MLREGQVKTQVCPMRNRSTDDMRLSQTVSGEIELDVTEIKGGMERERREGAVMREQEKSDEGTV